MSLDTRGLDPQRLLPQSLEDRLLGWVGRFGGAILLGLTVLIWISLVSWSVLDPSLTHTTTAAARNFAGPVGAIISDLLFQMLGFGAVLALVAPVVWGIEMLRSERVADGRMKLGFYPLSILALAGAISALPVMSGWPLRHGYGGLLGDGVYHLALKIFCDAERGAGAARSRLRASGGGVPDVGQSDRLRGRNRDSSRFCGRLSSGLRFATSKRRWEEADRGRSSLAAGADRVRQRLVQARIRRRRVRACESYSFARRILLTRRRRRSISIRSALARRRRMTERIVRSGRATHQTRRGARALPDHDTRDTDDVPSEAFVRASRR